MAQPQVPSNDPRRVFSCNAQSGAQVGQAILLTRPDESFEPPDLLNIVHINGVQVDAGTPDHLRAFLGQRCISAGGAPEDWWLTGTAASGQDAVLAVVIGIPVGDQAKPC